MLIKSLGLGLLLSALVAGHANGGADHEDLADEVARIIDQSPGSHVQDLDPRPNQKDIELIVGTIRKCLGQDWHADLNEVLELLIQINREGYIYDVKGARDVNGATPRKALLGRGVVHTIWQSIPRPRLTFRPDD